MRFLFYSHDGLGLGHTRRHLAVATALTELVPEASVLLATGADDVNRLGLPPHVEILKLPGLRKVANDRYASRRLRIPVSEIRSLRSALLVATVQSFRPSVVLVDKHPFGAGGEFWAALEVVRAAGGRAVLGLRDILDERAAVLAEWQPHQIQDRINEFYDLVLVYGHRSVFDPIAEYEFPTSVAQRTSFCGYVVNQEENALPADPPATPVTLTRNGHPVVLATAGGGEDGYLLLQTFIRAAANAPWRGVVVAGPMTPENEFESLQRLTAEAKVEFHPFVSNLSKLFWSADALVCMGGYNTLAEAVSKGVPTVCVPRTSPRAEQLMRASAFERLGLLRVIRPEQLNIETLRQQIDAALKMSRQELLNRAHAALSFDGARQSASHLLALWRREIEPRRQQHHAAAAAATS